MKEGRRRFLQRSALGLGGLFLTSCVAVRVEVETRDRKRIDNLENDKYITVDRFTDDAISISITSKAAQEMTKGSSPTLIRSDINLIAQKYYPNTDVKYSAIVQKELVWGAIITKGNRRYVLSIDEEQKKQGLKVITDEDK